MTGQNSTGPNKAPEALTNGAPQPLSPRSISPVSTDVTDSDSESDTEIAGSFRSTRKQRTAIYGIMPANVAISNGNGLSAKDSIAKNFTEETAKSSDSTTGLRPLIPEAQAELPNGPELSSEEALDKIAASADKVKYYGIGLAGLKGAVLGGYTIISLALIAISLTITFTTFTLSAILSAPVTVPILIAAAVVASLLVAYNYIKKERKEQENQQKLIEQNKTSAEIYNKQKEKTTRFEKEFDSIYGNLLENYKTLIKNANLSTEKKQQLLNQIEEKYKLTKRRALEKYTSLNNSTAFYIKDLEKPATEISMWQRFTRFFTISSLTKKGSQFRNPMGVFEGASVILGGPAATETEPKGGTGFYTEEAASSALGFTITSIWADFVHKNWIIRARRKNIERLTKELAIKEEFIKTANIHELEVAEEWSIAARETLCNQGIDLPPPYEVAFSNNVAELQSLHSAKELENIKSSYAKVSGVGKALAGVCGFITGAYTILSLALIGISLTIIFGLFTLGTILTAPVSGTILFFAVVAGVVLFRSNVKKEKAAQEKLNSYIDVNHSSTKEYQTKVAIEKPEFQAKFAKRHVKNLREHIQKIKSDAQQLRLSPKETEYFVNKLKDRYEFIKIKAESDFSALQFSVTNKIKELNQPKPKLSMLQTIKNGWKTFREKFTTWGSWLRSSAGGVEGVSIIAGGSLLASAESFTPGTGFIGPAAGGVAIGAAAISVTANLAYQKGIVEPRNKSVSDLEKALTIKVDSVNEAKKIDLIAHSQLAQATEEIEKEITQLAQKKAALRHTSPTNQYFNLDPSTPKPSISPPRDVNVVKLSG